MKRFGKKLLTVTSVLAFSMAALAGCGQVKNTDVVAEVGEDEITVGVANFYARMQQAQYETYYSGFMGDNMWETEISEGVTYEETFKDSLLENLENMYLMEDHMEDFDVELTEDDQTKIQNAVTTFLENNSLEDKEIISAEEEYVTRVLELFTIQSKMEPMMTTGVDEEVSDEEAAQKSMQYVLFSYTKENEDGTTEDMTDDEKALVKETAQNFLNQMNESGSDDLEAAAADAGVEVQTLTFDSETTSISTDVISAVDALETEGEMTDLIETDSGCYIAKLTSLLDREATDAKKTEIVNERQQEQYNSLLEQWREDTEITEYDKVWKKVSFIKQGVTIKLEEDEEYATGSGTTEE